MKKLQIVLGLGIISAMFLFNACEEETTNSYPVISYDDASPVTLEPGEDSYSVTGDIVAEAGLESVTVTKTTATGGTVPVATIDDFESGEVTQVDDSTYNFRFELSDITEETTLEITAVDKDAQEASKSIVIQVTAGNPISSFTAVLMGGQGNNSVGSFLDADGGDVYLQAAAESNAALIDVVYYYGSSNLATLTAPDDATVNGGAGNLSLCADFTVKNDTRFGTSSISATAFDAIENDAEISAITGLSASKMTDLAVNDVIEFITAEGKKGLIKVANMTTGSDGTITIDVKIQQ
jgi:hypothetical protein